MSNAALSVITSDPPEKWQEILADLITDSKELTEILQLDSNPGSDSLLAQSGLDRFSLKVPKPFAQRMQTGNWNDPLLRQVCRASWRTRWILRSVKIPCRKEVSIRHKDCCKNTGSCPAYCRASLCSTLPLLLQATL